jgi:hypothetical protein
VARQLTHDELEKAAHNLERIDGYLAPRSRWTVPPVHLDTLASMRRSVARLRRLMQSAAPARPTAPAGHARAFAPLDPAELDGDQLHGFASFLERLDRWLEASGAVPPKTGATELLVRIVVSLEATDRALEAIGGEPAPAVRHTPAPPAAALPPTRHAPASPIAGAPPARHASAAPIAGAPSPRHAPAAPIAGAAPARTAAGRSAGPAAIVDDVFAGAPRPAAPAGPTPVEQIALTASEADPMFRWIGPEDVELTPRARERIEQLFAAQGITFFRYQLENFASEVRRRIKSAPEGHVLVIKVRDIGGERKPFLSYVPAKMIENS